MANRPGNEANGVNPSPWQGRRNLMILAIAVIIVAIAFTAWWFLLGRYWVSVDDAYVQGNKYPITAQVSGQVDQVLAYGTETVGAGQPLVRLRARRLAARLRAAQAKVARESDEAHALLAKIAGARANIQALTAQLIAARARSERLGLAAQSGASAGLDAIVAQQKVQELQSQQRAAQSELAALEKQLGEHGPAGYPPLLQAQAELALARIDWQRRSIRAPVAGVLAQEAVQPGEHIQPGQRLFTVVPLNQIWVDAYVKETRLAGVEPGAEVQLRSDLYGSSVRYRGRVVSIGAATGAEFAVLPPENASGNWIKFTQRVPVRILVDSKDLEKHPLRPGLTMHADIRRYGPRQSLVLPPWFTQRRLEPRSADPTP